MSENNLISELIHEIKCSLSDYLNYKGKQITSTGHFSCPFPYNHKRGDAVASAHMTTQPDGIQVWYCHTCGANGTIYDMLNAEEGINIEGPGFIKATLYLAETLGIHIDEELINTEDIKYYTSIKEDFEIYKEIENYLLEHGNPIDSLCDPDFGRNYSREHAIKIIEMLPIGCVDHEEMFKYLEDKFGEKFTNTVLYKYTKPNTVFGKNTLTLSYRDSTGKAIRFIGRYRNSYIESSENTIHKYCQTVGLFGKIKESPFMMDIALPAIRKNRKVIIAEGEFDTIALQLMGIENAIGSRGVSIPEHFMDLLFNLKINEAVLVFDGDMAGISSIRKHHDMFLKYDIPLFICSLEENRDPDNYICEGEIIDISKAMYSAEFLLTHHPDFINTSIPEVKRYANCIGFLAKSVPLAIYQKKYCDEIISEMFGYHSDIIFTDVQNYMQGIETKDLRVKKIQENVEKVKDSPIMERINTYEIAADQLKEIINEKGKDVLLKTYNTFMSIKRNDIKLPTKIHTGIIDDYCSLLTSTLSLWAGWPSNGKSTVTRNIARSIIDNNKVIRNGRRIIDEEPFILHFSLDDDDRNTMLNYISMITDSYTTDLRRTISEGSWNINDVANYDDIIAEYFRDYIFIFNITDCPDVLAAGRLMSMMRNRYPRRTMITIVDAINNFVDFNKDNQLAAAEAVVRDLKRYASRYDSHVALVTHFTKHKGETRRPRLSDIKGTSFLEHEPQNIFLIYMDVRYNKMNSEMVWDCQEGGTIKTNPVIEMNIAKDKGHDINQTMSFNFNPRGNKIIEPNEYEIERYLEIINKS